MFVTRWIVLASLTLCAGFTQAKEAPGGEEPVVPVPIVPPPVTAPVPETFNIQVEPTHLREMKDVFMPRMERFAQSLVKAAYVGVGVEEADVTLRKQLKLADGIGLAVKTVDENGPAGVAGVKVHDVLVKLKEQHLVNLQQFVTLVRMNKPGEKIELSLYREGALQTVTVTVGEKELPPLESYARTGGSFVREINNQMPFTMALPAGGPSVGGLGFAGVPAGNGMVQFQDEDHIIHYSMMGDKPTFKVQSKDGKVIYEGDPKTAPEDIKKLVEKYKVLEMARPNVMFFEHKVLEGPKPIQVTPSKPLAPPEKENF